MKKFLLAAALTAALTTTASAQDARVHVRGKVVSLTGNVLTVGAAIGDVTTKVTLAPNYTVQYVVPMKLTDIKPGSWVGTAAVTQVDGSLRALEVHIFPPGVKGGAGSHPYDLLPASTMTNGNVDAIAATKVDNVNGSKITISYDGGSKEVTIAPGTPVVGFEPATPDALTPGARVNILATKNADGSLSAAGVSVGKDGLVPPM
jgi:opacity protein-like surface antigen